MKEVLCREVITPASTYLFKAKVHVSDQPEEQKIEPEFYKEEAGKVHEGKHHELQLIESPVWQSINRNVPIHIHQNPVSEEYYVCFTGQVSSLKEAEAVFSLWCAGTVYTIEHSEDFGPMAAKHQEDFNSFLASEYNITVHEP